MPDYESAFAGHKAAQELQARQAASVARSAAGYGGPIRHEHNFVVRFFRAILGWIGRIALAFTLFVVGAVIVGTLLILLLER